MQDVEPDVDTLEEGLFDLYVIYCMNNHETPSISDYVVWKEENYG